MSAARPPASDPAGSARLQTQLSEVETQLSDMAALLVRGDAPAFSAVATALRQSMLELAHAGAQEAASTWQDPVIRDRMQAVAQALVRQRDNLARCAVVAERGLAAVLPPRAVTYDAPGRTGVFRGATARIYTKPAS